jgi:hypothetical protein
MRLLDSEIIGFLKPSLDAHTLGVNSVAEMLRECGYRVILGSPEVNTAINTIKYEPNREVLYRWIRENGITRIGLSYRLDEEEAADLFGQLMYGLEQQQMFHYQGGPIRGVFFAGLPKACEQVSKRYKGFVKTFKGGESVQKTLTLLGVPEERIPNALKEGSRYDDFRLEFGKKVIDEGTYRNFQPVKRPFYPEFGTAADTLVKRLDASMGPDFAPLMRAHVGPYSSHVSRWESVKEFLSWAESLAKAGYLDILSIGTSQLSQSHFGEDWGDQPNGGGVPINSPEEFRRVWEASRPLLVRTYAGTNRIPELAAMYEETIHIAWHALSLWWFNRLDGRGPLDVYTNLRQHIETLKFIAKTDKPFEPNIPHHFAFRGADDVTYIVSAVLAAKLAKKIGVRTLVLQNMLNTPRSTWGIQDLAKSRAMLTLVKELADENFRVVLQPRAGLDYFSPDLEEAKIQLAAVTALMDDIDPWNEQSPPVIHVVSYSEASHLATPDIVNESIQITHQALREYRKLRRAGKIEDMSHHPDVEERKNELLASARQIIGGIEKHIEQPYSAEGLYLAYAAGFLPTPYIWGEVEEFKYAKAWKTKLDKGSIKVVDENNQVVPSSKVVEKAAGHLEEAKWQLRVKYGVRID